MCNPQRKIPRQGKTPPVFVLYTHYIMYFFLCTLYFRELEREKIYTTKKFYSSNQIFSGFPTNYGYITKTLISAALSFSLNRSFRLVCGHDFPDLISDIRGFPLCIGNQLVQLYFKDVRIEFNRLPNVDHFISRLL